MVFAELISVAEIREDIGYIDLGFKTYNEKSPPNSKMMGIVTLFAINKTNFSISSSYTRKVIFYVCNGNLRI